MSSHDRDPSEMPRVIAVISGKGGVGKSSIAVLLASILSEIHSTALLDFDICGPSVTTALGVSGGLVKTENGFKPIGCGKNLDVLSFGSILNPKDAVIWRGPKKLMFLEMFFNSVQNYEYVVIDTPPGISEEHSFIANKGVEAVIVTTPQNIALNDTQRCIEFCTDRKISVLGVIENMCSLQCECCSEVSYPFGSKGGKQLAEEYHVPFLGELPIEPRLTSLIDTGLLRDEYKTLKTCTALRSVLADCGLIA